MPKKLSYSDICEAVSIGGASSLSIAAKVAPAGGDMAGVVPAKYATSNGGPAYCFQQRLINSELRDVVLVDSVGSTSNRSEQILAEGIRNNFGELAKTPRMSLTYFKENPEKEEIKFYDCEISHRMVDAHFRAGKFNGVNLVENDDYKTARNASRDNLMSIMELSPVSLIFGAWDSTRKGKQLRLARIVTGETIGVLPVCLDKNSLSKGGGARLDIVSAGYEPNIKDNIKNIAANMGLHDTTNKKKPSDIGFGHIPPGGIDALGPVACTDVYRFHWISFSRLRQMRFGNEIELDVTCRALLAALALNLTVKSNEDLAFRSGCELDLIEDVKISIKRRGTSEEYMDLSVDDVDALLSEAIGYAVEKGVKWEGQELEIVGSELLENSILAEG